MNDFSLRCRDEQRRHMVRKHDLNGLDYLEVSKDQLSLKVYFLGNTPKGLTKKKALDHVRIEGGQRIQNIRIRKIALDTQNKKDYYNYMTVYLYNYGDHSTYSLRLVGLDGVDPRYDHLDFNFKVGCPSDLDCRTGEICPPFKLPEPAIDYLAKDYASFRQLILDRLALIMPDWKERHVPDLGIALVELLAYVGDYLSYYQDAVATEAYLQTARQRTSVRRHVRLVDYLMHEGNNSRAWVCVETEDITTLRPDDYFLVPTGKSLPIQGNSIKHDDLLLKGISSDQYLIFEPMIKESVEFYKAHNEIQIYSWGDRECCLKAGATNAVLKDEWMPEKEKEPETLRVEQQLQSKPPTSQHSTQPQEIRKLQLKPGDVLIFEEIKGPKTGNPDDADPKHRHAVRLTRVERDSDNLLKDKNGKNQPIVTVEWAHEDALPFPLCISSLDEECNLIENVSIARGNVVLVDHGRTFKDEILITPRAEEENAGCIAVGEPLDSIIKPSFFRPQLKYFPVTHSVPFPEPSISCRIQAQILAGLMDKVLEKVRELARKSKKGKCLTQEEIDEVFRIFGRKALEEFKKNFDKMVKGHKHHCKAQAKALERLLAMERVYLAKKRRRVNLLTDKARSGYLMGRNEMNEIEEMFGSGFVVNLANPDHLIPAYLSLLQDPREALPCIQIEDENRWTAKRDLLDSGPLDRNFVAEIENDGSARLRFGDGELGRVPEPEAVLKASYRVGNGQAGNVGAEAISYLVFRTSSQDGVIRVRNPLPAKGGRDPEPITDVKLFAPGTFRKNMQRAITAEDYARLVERDFDESVQRAAAEMRWNGSWYEVRVAVDPRGKTNADEFLLTNIVGRLHRYRRIGHNLAVKPARYVPIDIEIEVCVLPHHYRGQVKAALLEVLSNRITPDGRRGFFHPDNLTFGESIRLSKLISAATSVKGVETARVTRLERLFEGPYHEIEEGILPIGPLEVARLDNDPSFPENGRLALQMRGGL